jgi:hypothetical protein
MRRCINLYSNDILAHPRTKMAICSVPATTSLLERNANAGEALTPPDAGLEKQSQ